MMGQRKAVHKVGLVQVVKQFSIDDILISQFVTKMNASFVSSLNVMALAIPKIDDRAEGPKASTLTGAPCWGLSGL